MFQQIRVKHIEYLEKKAIAVYFTNVSHHVKQLRLEKEVVTEQNRVETLESYTSTISHEFRTPLATCLTFLDSLMQMDLPPRCIQMLKLVIAQLNMLLCLVNDVLDLKQIEAGEFEQKNANFNPLAILEFISSMFEYHAEMKKTEIVTKTVSL